MAVTQADIEGKHLSANDFEAKQTLYVNAWPLLRKPCVIRTTHGEVLRSIVTTKKTMKQKGKRYALGLYRHIYQLVINQNDDELAAKAANNDTEPWQNFCDDIVLLYSMRQAIFKKEIPISINKPQGGKDIIPETFQD